MSWMFGFIGASLSPTRREGLAALHPEALWVDAAAGYYLAAGGLPETCRAGTLPEGGSWAVVGVGLEGHEDHCTFLRADAWRERLIPPAPLLDGLDGHFVAVRRRAGRVEAFTDVLGVRTCYLTRLPDGIALATRLDWLAMLRGGADVDLEAFGAHWLTFNQLTPTSLARGVRRLGPGGRAVCSAGGYEATECPWTPEITPTDRDGTAFARTLSAFVHPRMDDARTPSLGLSGGLDSRLLLALRVPDHAAYLHVFGPDDHPDVQVARKIARAEGLPLRHLNEPVPDAPTCLRLLRNHVAQTQAVSAASSVLGLRYYPALHDQGCVMIDGGLGEAARRQFMNRLLRKGRAALRTGNAAALLPYLRVPRADVFTSEATAEMERGARRQLDALWQALPDAHDVGEENALDLLGVRTRLPNFFGYEQNRLDGVIQNYMPFAQPSVLRAVFRTPVMLRRNGRLFRRLIRARCPSLTRPPLVKGGVTYPFRLPTLPAYLFTKAKTRLGLAYTDQRRLHFLETLRPYVRDLVRAESVRAYPAYDHPRLQRLVDAFYDGAEHLAAAVDWWLAFEAWRQQLANGAS